MMRAFRRSSSGPSDPRVALSIPRERVHASAFEGFLRGGASARRSTAVGSFVAVILLAGISIGLAWRQYDDAKQQALKDLDARVVAVSGILDTYFGGQMATLGAIAKAPSVVSGNTGAMSSFFKRVQAAPKPPFSGGIGWIGLDGKLRATSNPTAKRLDFSDRPYFRQVLKTGRPYVSAGLVGRQTKQPVVVDAFPTLDAQGRISGVLIGSLVLKAVKESRQALDLGYGDLQVVDRDGQLLLSRLSRVTNHELLTQLERRRAGIEPSTRGLDGNGGHVVAFAMSTVPGWLVAIDRPRSSVFAAARRSFMLELVSVGASVLLVLGILAFVLRRSRRELVARDARARSWGGLTRALVSASTPPAVAEALLASLASAFPGAVAIVAFESSGGLRVKAASRRAHARGILESAALLGKVAHLTREGPRSRQLEDEPSLAEVHSLTGRRFRALHGLPINGPGEEAVGTISLLSDSAVLEPSDWALLGSFADQAAQALERTLVFAHEHELAVRLQRELLPGRLPSGDGAELAGNYLAGGAGVEVGGDWYDAVRRPDGILQLCVGDVSGRGIGAATVMGRQRHIFTAYAYDCVSPAEIIRRMMRHVESDEMITLACVSIDPFTGELAYSCAGHPPPLLLDSDSSEVARLDRASAPPLGVAEPADIVEATIGLPEHAVLAMYTDGLIERRGENIDDGIDLLARMIVAVGTDVTPESIVGRVAGEIGEPADDMALLIVALDSARAAFEVEVPAEAGSLPEIRRRLRAWLQRRRFDEEQVAEVLIAVGEACNNAIEHAYRDLDGTIRLSVDDEWQTLRIVVEDQGRWRDEVPNDERGRGIMLMKNLMHSAEIETTPRGTRVTLERRVRPDQEPTPDESPVGAPA